MKHIKIKNHIWFANIIHTQTHIQKLHLQIQPFLLNDQPKRWCLNISHINIPLEVVKILRLVQRF